MNCPLCRIPENEPLLYEDDLFYICKTNVKRGHSKRIMIVCFEHTVKVSSEPFMKMVLTLLEFGIQYFCPDEWMVKAPRLRSVPYHFHVVASTVYTSSEEQRIRLASIPTLWRMTY